MAADKRIDGNVGPWPAPGIGSDGKLTEALVIHSHGRIVYISELSARWMGANSPDEVIGRAVTDVVPPDQVYAMWEANRLLHKVGDRSARLRTVIVRLDGSTSDCEVVMTRIEWEGAPGFQIELYETAPQVAAEHSLEHQLALIAHASDALVSTSFHGFITSWNPAAERMFDIAADSALGAHISEVANGQLHPVAAVAGGGVGHITVLGADNTLAWIRVSVSTMHNGYVLVCADHTALHRAEKRLQSILESHDNGLLVVGSSGVIESVNPAAARLFGWNPMGRRWPDVIEATRSMAYDAAGGPLNFDPTELTRLTGAPVISLVIGYDRGPSDRVWLSLHCRQLDSDDPSDTAVLVSCADITEQHLLSERLAHAATHDDLTGLFNRAHALNLVSTSLSAGAHDLAAVLFIDLDNLKVVNDSFGHGAGDHLLQISAQRLAAAVRDDDVVARIGGDEFVCLLRGPSAGELLGVCAGIHRMIQQPIHYHGVVLSTGASIGVRLLSEHDADPARILADADRAMYNAKAAGRGQTRVFGRD